MQVITLKEHPDYLAEAIRYFQKQWAGPDSLMVYEDSLTHSFSANPLPQWLLLVNEEIAADGRYQIIGCGGFVSKESCEPGFVLCALRNCSRRTLSNHRLRRLDPQRLHQSDGFDPLALRLVCGPFVAWPRRCPPFDRNSQATCCWSWF